MTRRRIKITSNRFMMFFAHFEFSFEAMSTLKLVDELTV